MKPVFEICGETFAAVAALLWFASARIRLKQRSEIKKGLHSAADDPNTLLQLVYAQSHWSAWAAIAAGLAALFALADGLVPGT
jgi:hypothetical protein